MLNSQIHYQAAHTNARIQAVLQPALSGLEETGIIFYFTTQNE
jgi:hypothetical protein